MSKKVSQNYNSALLEQMSERPIVFNPALARLAKSAGAGLFLSQLLYWWGKGRNRDWIYKTIAEIQGETSLTRSEQERAIKIWKGLGILVVVRKGIPAKRYFHIDTRRLINLFIYSNTANKFAESNKQACSKQQTITESTQESTSRDLVLQTLAAHDSFDIGAARMDLVNKFSINKNQKI